MNHTIPEAGNVRPTPPCSIGQNNLLPETGYVRLPQLIGNPKASPPIPAIFPFSKSTLWTKIKAGTFPAPIKLGPRITCWPVKSIRDFIENGGAM